MMQIERSRLQALLRDRGGESTAQVVGERLPEQIDTQRDRQLLKDCGIDPNVLETIIPRSGS